MADADYIINADADYDATADEVIPSAIPDEHMDKVTFLPML